MKKYLFSFLCLLASVASAATYRVTDGAETWACDYSVVQTTPAGDIVVKCTTPIIPTPLPTPPKCSVPAPTRPNIINTGSIVSLWTRHDYTPVAGASYAFKVTVPAGFVKRGNGVAINASTSARAPRVVLSDQPNCPDAFQGQVACSASGLDGSTIKMSGNLSDTIYYCKLPPGDYYLNAFIPATCGDACAFMFTRSAPY